MPRIEAENLEAHVSARRARILDAAIRLFAEHGYSATDMGDIAAAVGLRRNSLYRYFANKDHILFACLKREMEPHLDRLRSLDKTVTDPRQRVDAWLELQLQTVANSCHGMIHMATEISDAAPELRDDVMALHRLPNQVLRNAVAELLDRRSRDPQLVSEMIAGMLRAAAEATLNGRRVKHVLRELKLSVGRLLD